MKRSRPTLVGVLADTHDQVERTRLAVAELVREGASCLVHCGDLTGPEIVSACSVLPSYFVFGNNDGERDALRTAMRRHHGKCLEDGGEIAIGGIRVAVTHGHDRPLLRRLLSAQPAFVFVGHSHRRGERQEGTSRIINPGALHRAHPWSVALVDLARGEVRYLDIGE